MKVLLRLRKEYVKEEDKLKLAWMELEVDESLLTVANGFLAQVPGIQKIVEDVTNNE